MNKKKHTVDLKYYDEEGNLKGSATFPSVTLKANETITSVFTIKDGKVYVHLEFKDADGKLIYKTRKKRWKYPLILF